MAWKILKQFNANSNTVWVEKLTEEDTVESFSTKKAGNARIVELQAIDNTRNYKVIKT
jgi:hypothetical protein|tara:strand:- start:148 stop:321 length:174 start_codon:yes stop_codon:yes gene_type:complete